MNPYLSRATILDCGDIPVTPIDNKVALDQMTMALEELGHRSPADKDGFAHPRLMILGGDHSLSLPALRSLKWLYGPVAVLHFDAHLDTLHPSSYPSSLAGPADFNHGSMFWMAHREGLIRDSSSVHAGLHTRLSGTDWSSYLNDDEQGFFRIGAEEIDEIGVRGVISRIRDRIGLETPVYLSIDIDVLDPAFAPGTGAPETGGWTTRELLSILSGVRDLNVVGADIVEVSPPFDSLGGDTAFAAATLAYEIITSWVIGGFGDGEHQGQDQRGRDEL